MRELTVAYGLARQLSKISAFLCQSAVTRGIDLDKDILASVTEFATLGLVGTSPVRVGWVGSLGQP